MTSPIELENELYAGLPEAVRQELSRSQEAATVAPGTRLVQNDVIPEALIIVNSGTVQSTVVVAGKEMSLGIAGPGRVLALHSIMTGTAPNTTVTTLEECKVTIVPKRVFLDLLERHPEMYFAVVKVLSTDLVNADRLIRECARGFQAKPSTALRPA